MILGIGTASACATPSLGNPPIDNAITSTAPSSPADSRKAFIYDRASPSVRWPHLQQKLTDVSFKSSGSAKLEAVEPAPHVQFTGPWTGDEEERGVTQLQFTPTRTADSSVAVAREGSTLPKRSDYQLLVGKERRRKVSKLALLKAKDWRERVQRLSEAVLELEQDQTVADLLNKWPEQMAPTDYCFLVKQVGYTHWRRALELFEWLNMKHWYTPNNRMLSTILGVLGRVNQVKLAEEIFQRAEPELGDCVQVFNAMMSVYARHGNWERMQVVLKLMLERGCERDLVTYNTLISGRARAGLKPGMAMELLGEIWKAGLRPDTVTYNTLIGACSSSFCYEDAVKVYEEMKEQKCQADIWTYNSMISVYGRCGLDEFAEEVYLSMKAKGFSPDAITYNSMLYAYAKKGRVEDVEAIRKQMTVAGRNADEITYNTMIHMYGKKNLIEKALDTYEQMKHSRCCPDTVTFTVLIDCLGKAGLVKDAERVFRELTEANLKTSLNTFSAMICAYVKARMFKKAENIIEIMLQAGIQPDKLAYSVMLDVFLNTGQAGKVLSTYQSMVTKGHKPGLTQCGLMLSVYKRAGLNAEMEQLSQDMQHLGFDPAALCTTFAKVGLCDAAERALREALSQGIGVDAPTINLLLTTYAKLRRFEDARLLVASLSSPGKQPIREQLIIILAKAEKFEEVKQELVAMKDAGHIIGLNVFRALIVAYELAEMLEEALQTMREMQDAGVVPDFVCYRSAILACCRLGNPDEGYILLQRIKDDHGTLKDSTLHISLIKAYIKQYQWEKSENTFRDLSESSIPVTLKDYNMVLLAYARYGQCHQVEDLLKKMIRDGLTPSSNSGNDLLKALLMAKRVTEVEEVYELLVELGIPTDMQTSLIMLDFYVKNGSIVKAKCMYQELRNKGYELPAWAFTSLIGLFSKTGCVEDAECTLKEMQESGFQPDTFVFNAMISLYSKVGSFKKAVQVFQGMQAVGFSPDKVTYNILIHVYSRRLLVQEARALLQQMKHVGLAPDLASYSMLLSAYGQLQMWEAATACFEEMQELGIRPNEAIYNIMLDVYRRAGKSELSHDLVTHMKEVGLEPTTTALNMLMDSYGKGGNPKEAEAVFKEMVEAGVDVDVIQYTSLIDGYLKGGDHEAAVSKLKKMHVEGIAPNYVTWTCIVGAASKCRTRKETLALLRALHETGFSLPLRLLTERSSSLLVEVDRLLESLQAYGSGAGSGLLNVLQDLLWAFEKRATAARIFQLAVEKNSYGREFTRVQEGDWEADLCKLSPGAALVALTLWLIQMQEAALQGSPLSSKSVLLIVGSSKRSNDLSLSKTLKSHLWEMGSPFLVSKTRAGVLIAKGHSLRMWLKDSPKCLDLELEDRSSLPELNSMVLYEGAWMRVDMVPVLKQIEESMGSSLRPKKFMRLVNMHDEKRADVIAADIKGRAEKIAKDRAKKQMINLGLPCTPTSTV